MSDDVRRFVLTSIPSVPYLEAALLFHGSPERERTAREVAGALYIHERAASELLQALCDAGILRRDGDLHAYAPRSEPLRRALDGLARAYPGNLIAITHLIHDTTRKNATRFADAFKLRKSP